jgi:hypothetical protein
MQTLLRIRRPVRRISTQMPNTLPRLPVPPLRQSLDAYLKSIQPFLLEDEARGGASYASSFAQRVIWAEKFENGIGKVCQERLIGKPNSSSHVPTLTPKKPSTSSPRTTGSTITSGRVKPISNGALRCWLIRIGGWRLTTMRVSQRKF